jgi:hypothetical protein
MLPSPRTTCERADSALPAKYDKKRVNITLAKQVAMKRVVTAAAGLGESKP